MPKIKEMLEYVVLEQLRNKVIKSLPKRACDLEFTRFIGLDLLYKYKLDGKKKTGFIKIIIN